MKKIYSMLFALAMLHRALAGGSCAIDSANTQFFAPGPDSLPCIERTMAYNQVIQIAVPTSVNLQDFGAPIPFVLTVDSMVVTGVNGLPNGINYVLNPANGVLYGGDQGCALVYGSTTDNPGHYPVTFTGTFTAHGTAFPPYFDGDTTIDIATLQNLSQGMFDMYVDVINPGDPCRPASGVGLLNADLNSSISVFPNPSEGRFHISLHTGRNIRGVLEVVDVTGRILYSKTVDVTDVLEEEVALQHAAAGLYTVVLKTPEGIAAKNISVQ